MYISFKEMGKSILRKLDKFSDEPHFCSFLMSDSEKAVFDEVIKDSKHYLEFGLGGSTLHALQNSNCQIYTVESSTEWINYMQRHELIKTYEDDRLFIYPVDIGPLSYWGYPKSKNNKELFPIYSSNIFQNISSQLIDLALIDGRFRVACTLKVILECYENDNIKILIHDFWGERPHYHTVLKYLDTINKADTLGLFSIKDDIDLQSVEKEYEKYKFIPK